MSALANPDIIIHEMNQSSISGDKIADAGKNTYTNVKDSVFGASEVVTPNSVPASANLDIINQWSISGGMDKIPDTNAVKDSVFGVSEASDIIIHEINRSYISI